MQNINVFNEKSEKLKPLHIQLINILKTHGPLSRPELVKILNKPRTTIYDNLNQLMQKDLIKKFNRQLNSRGRPIVFFKLKED
ncbi:MAG: helix-turn-helix domain-containing protein [Promethearchaeota archaeon]